MNDLAEKKAAVAAELYERGLECRRIYDDTKGCVILLLAAQLGCRLVNRDYGFATEYADVADEDVLWLLEAANDLPPEGESDGRLYEELEARARNGNAWAKYMFGIYQYALDRNAPEDIQGWCGRWLPGAANYIKYFEEAAEAGYAPAQYMLGKCLLDGIGVYENLEKAVKWLRLSMEQGCADAMFVLGENAYEDAQGMLDAGLGEGRSEQEIEDQGSEWILQAAKMGCAEALYYAADNWLVDDGEYIDFKTRAAEQGHEYAMMDLIKEQDDPAEILRWLRVRAEIGYKEAQVELGDRFYKGNGVEKDPEEALKWLEMAVTGWTYPDQAALEKLVDWFPDRIFAGAEKLNGWADGFYNRKDFRRAVVLYRRAAEQGHADAMTNLAVCFYHGRGVEQKVIEARPLLEKASALGSKRADELLQKWYTYPKKSTPSNGQEQKTAEVGELMVEEYDEAAVKLMNQVYRLYHGLGMEKDPEEARRLLEKSAAQGNEKAKERLKEWFPQPKAAEKPSSSVQEQKAPDIGEQLLRAKALMEKGDNEGAVKLIRVAAEAGAAEAQYAYGVAFANGTGVRKDMAEAVRWNRLAAEQGFVRSQAWLGAHYLDVCQYEEAFRWILSAAKAGDADSQNMAGTCYMTGLGTYKDRDVALMWYRAAAAQGHAGAKQALEEHDKPLLTRIRKYLFGK